MINLFLAVFFRLLYLQQPTVFGHSFKLNGKVTPPFVSSLPIHHPCLPIVLFSFTTLALTTLNTAAP